MSRGALTRRARNRALLARQLLLERVEVPVAEAVHHLVGLQAQEPPDPYVALWTRLTDFRPEELADLLLARGVARSSLMRGTIHLTSAADLLAIRPLVQPLHERVLASSAFGRQTQGIDRDELLTAGQAILDEQPRTSSELGRLLAERWPDRDPTSLAMVIRYVAPLVQVPPRGVWGRSGRATWATVETWLGQSLDGPDEKRAAIETLTLRYLAAFGPATPADMRAWSGITALREVFERLRPRLVTFTDENGRELFDLPDASRPDPETPAPVRFLPQYDNVLLSHADRGHVVEASIRAAYGGGERFMAPILVDGFGAATWWIERLPPRERVVHVELGRAISAAEREALEAEGERLAAFFATDGSRGEVRLADVPSSMPARPVR